MGISLGLVGLGQFGKAFADMFMNHPLVDRIALCDREPERMDVFADKPLWQKKFDRRDMYASLDEIVKSDLDALVIITQPWLHAPQCVQAMEAGKHVYSAVPIISIPDGDEIHYTEYRQQDCGGLQRRNDQRHERDGDNAHAAAEAAFGDTEQQYGRHSDKIEPWIIDHASFLECVCHHARVQILPALARRDTYRTQSFMF